MSAAPSRKPAKVRPAKAAAGGFAFDMNDGGDARDAEFKRAS